VTERDQAPAPHSPTDGGPEPAAARPPSSARSARLYAYLLSALALGAVLYPIWLDPQDPAQDGFPLSTYPMFSYDKPRTATVTSAVALGPDGAEQPVPPEFVATSETMQALRTIAKSVRAGRAQSRQLCESIAAHVARSSEPGFARAERVALITVTVDSIRFLAGDRTPLHRDQHVRCPVRRDAP
jgi:hypothetical protein